MNLLPAVPFTPAQNHKVKFAIAFINEVPGISEKTCQNIMLLIFMIEKGILDLFN